MTARSLTFAIDFDCGDDQGRVTDHFEAVEVYLVEGGAEEHALSLSGPRTALDLRATSRCITVSGRPFLCLPTKPRTCVGNLCWHGAYLCWAELRPLLNHLALLGFGLDEWSKLHPTLALVEELWP